MNAIDYAALSKAQKDRNAVNLRAAQKPIKVNFRQQLLAAAKASGIRETPAEMVIRLREEVKQHRKDRDASSSISRACFLNNNANSCLSRMKDICGRFKLPMPEIR